MCTVTFIARKRGYALGMNRDEKLTRPKGLPPTLRLIDGVKVLCPSEPSGGTWIASNEHSVTFALINWYSVPARVEKRPTSRGSIILACSLSAKPTEADAALAKLALRRINPFRLIGVFPREREVIEWRWNLHRLDRVQHQWRTQQWISSGFDEATAQCVRGKSFQRALDQHSVGSLGWLSRLHRSHSPQAGPFSTCMHRNDAATVSYTEVTISSRLATMRYHPGRPCRSLGRSQVVAVRRVSSLSGSVAVRHLTDNLTYT